MKKLLVLTVFLLVGVHNVHALREVPAFHPCWGAEGYVGYVAPLWGPPNKNPDCTKWENEQAAAAQVAADRARVERISVLPGSFYYECKRTCDYDKNTDILVCDDCGKGRASMDQASNCAYISVYNDNLICQKKFIGPVVAVSASEAARMYEEAVDRKAKDEADKLARKKAAESAQ